MGEEKCDNELTINTIYNLLRLLKKKMERSEIGSTHEENEKII